MPMAWFCYARRTARCTSRRAARASAGPAAAARLTPVAVEEIDGAVVLTRAGLEPWLNDASRTEGTNWERGVLEKLALAALKEQRRARRWGIFFKLLTFAYLTFLVLIALLDWRGGGDRLASGKHTALVEVDGVIDAEGRTRAPTT